MTTPPDRPNPEQADPRIPVPPPPGDDTVERPSSADPSSASGSVPPPVEPPVPPAPAPSGYPVQPPSPGGYPPAPYGGQPVAAPGQPPSNPYGWQGAGTPPPSPGGQPYGGPQQPPAPYGGQPYGGQPFGGQPYGGQPYGGPGQPPASYGTPGDPSSQPPGQTTWGTPGGPGAPGPYGWQSGPAGVPPTPPRKSITGWIVGGIAFVVVVAVVLVAAFVVWPRLSDDSPTASSSQPAPSQSASPQQTYSGKAGGFSYTGDYKGTVNVDSATCDLGATSKGDVYLTAPSGAKPSDSPYLAMTVVSDNSLQLHTRVENKSFTEDLANSNGTFDIQKFGTNKALFIFDNVPAKTSDGKKEITVQGQIICTLTGTSPSGTPSGQTISNTGN